MFHLGPHVTESDVRILKDTKVVLLADVIRSVEHANGRCLEDVRGCRRRQRLVPHKCEYAYDSTRCRAFKCSNTLDTFELNASPFSLVIIISCGDSWVDEE